MRFEDSQAKYLARFIAKEMISREDVKSEQLPKGQGAYRPIRSKWTMKDLLDHVNGDNTFGHYLLNQESQVKMIAFDIDLCQKGHYLPYTDADITSYVDNPSLMEDEYFVECAPRAAWTDRKHPARPWFKLQMRELADRFAEGCHKFELKTFATYSGSKGVHVYGLLGERTDARFARELAADISNYVIEQLSRTGGDEYEFTPSKGSNFYTINSETAPLYRDFTNFTVEVFPKQDHIEPNRFGNLIRLPFGKNLKNPKDPTFMIDQTKSPVSLAPVREFDTIQSRLESGDPWQ